MTLISWIYMSVVWTLIVALNIFCFYRIFTVDQQKKKEWKNPPVNGKTDS